MRGSAKSIVFSLVPLVALVLMLEVGSRLWAVTDPQLITRPLPEEEGGLFREDPELFWSIKPNLDTTYHGKRVRSNSLGHRSPELGAKRAGEFRILSLGESSTFGTGVANGETYSDRLQHYLGQADPAHRYTVLNAGTPAHSSFQFMNYLARRGLALEPDLVLLYSELNDYLPASLRDSRNNELGVTMSDRELYAANRALVYNWFEAHSAFFRAVIYSRARASIERFQSEEVANPLVTIGLPKIGLRPRLFERRPGVGYFTPADIVEGVLPSRVSQKERGEHLQTIADLCEEHGVRLLIIHPSYRDSSSHDCLLTRFCADNEISIIEAQTFLHPPGVPLEELYLDDFHPSREGHDRLGRGLAERILKELGRDRL